MPFYTEIAVADFSPDKVLLLISFRQRNLVVPLKRSVRFGHKCRKADCYLSAVFGRPQRLITQVDNAFQIFLRFSR